jgi:hypothetical protein
VRIVGETDAIGFAAASDGPADFGGLELAPVGLSDGIVARLPR